VAKNHALVKATGEFVVSLDDDAYPLPGAVPQMIRHFEADPKLGAAVFDVTLPDGSKESSAYPDVFIGAGTGFRREAVLRAGGLPQDFFMQAEEYDLSFRLLEAGWKVRRFSDLPLLHLKSPRARIATRTTRLDVRNNLYLLAKYVPEPLCYTLASDWLTRYFMMAQTRDHAEAVGATAGATPALHKKAYLTGAAEGLQKWGAKREGGQHILSNGTIEQIFKLASTVARMKQAKARLGLRKILLVDLGKNIHAYLRAAELLNLEIAAISDDYLAAPTGITERKFRGHRILPWMQASGLAFDAVVISNLSPVHAERRTASLRRICPKNVLNLFGPTAPSFVRV
jgi:hypothetical protein